MKAIYISALLIALLLPGIAKSQCAVTPVAGFKYTTVTACTITLGWKQVNSAAGYQLLFKKVGSHKWLDTIVLGKVTSYQVNNLKDSTMYIFRISSICNNGQQGPKKDIKISTHKCAFPENITAGSISSTSATINWTPGCNVTESKLRYKVSGSSSWTTLNGLPVSVTLLNLQPATAYEYQLSSKGQSGFFSNWSPSQQVTTLSGVVHQPNIVLFLADDLRYDAFESTGGPSVVNTPAVNKIADEGANFKKTFATLSLCAPSRGAILTGLYNHKNGAMSNQGNMDTTLATVATILQANDYYTAFIGKYHLASVPQLGYNYWFVIANAKGGVNPQMNYNGKTKTVNGNITTILTDSAVKFINKINTKFFLVVGEFAPHEPYPTTPAFVNLFNNTFFDYPETFYKYVHNYPSCDYNNGSTLLSDSSDYEDLIRSYYESIVSMDNGMGQLVTALENRNLLDSTLFIFMSDNGHCYGEHIIDRKRLMYEESIHVPLFIRYPQWFAPGTVIDDQIAANIDIAPTILDAAGILNTYNMDGVSLKKLADHSVTRNQLFMEYFFDPNNEGIGLPSIRGVRTNQYKYVKYYCTGSTEEFFDLQNDPHEATNLINTAAYAPLITAFRYKLDSMRQALNDVGNDSLVTCSLQALFENRDENETIDDDEVTMPLNELSIYPNPAKEDFLVELFSGERTDAEITVTDVAGRQRVNMKTSLVKGRNFIPLSLPNASPGVYVIKAVSNGKALERKVVLK